MRTMRDLHLNSTNSPLSSLVHHLQEDKLNADPPYQRGSVWGTERCLALIKSVTIGLPIGSIFISERPFPEWPVVLDGKQRLLTVRGWMENKLLVPIEWFEDREIDIRDEFVRWDMLSDTGRRRWENSALVQVYWSSFRGSLEEIERQEKELFDLINFGGVPQGESDEV